jgi:hypothetical protein
LPCGRIYGPMALQPFNRAQDARRPISAGRHGAFRISRRAQAALAPAQGEDQGWFRIGRKRPTTAPARRVSGGIGILRTVQDADGSGADDCLQAGTDECEPSDERPQLHHPTAQGARRATKQRFVHDAAWSTSVRACPTCGPWGYDHTYSADQQPQQPQQHAKQATPQPCNVQRALTTRNMRCGDTTRPSRDHAILRSTPKCTPDPVRSSTMSCACSRRTIWTADRPRGMAAHATWRATVQRSHIWIADRFMSFTAACAQSDDVDGFVAACSSWLVAALGLASVRIHVAEGTAAAPELDPEVRPRRHRDWAHPCHICTRTAATAATSAPGLGSPVPHRHRDWAHPLRASTAVVSRVAS